MRDPSGLYILCGWLVVVFGGGGGGDGGVGVISDDVEDSDVAFAGVQMGKVISRRRDSVGGSESQLLRLLLRRRRRLRSRTRAHRHGQRRRWCYR